MNRQGTGKIEWTDYTWSPVTGCRHGCEYCYANRIAQRIYPEKFEPSMRGYRLSEPQRVKQPSKIFVCDMGDLFGEWVPDGWIAEVIAASLKAPQHTYQFLTKNPKRYGSISELFPRGAWVGTTIEHEGFYKERSEPFWNLTDPDIRRFVSMEPLLGPTPIDSAFDWVIIGERSDTPYNPEVEVWAKDIIDQARELDIPIFVKNRLKKKFPIQEFPT
jgi:protein gp37